MRRKTVNKLVAAVAVVTLTVSGLTGCGGADKAQADAAQNTDDTAQEAGSDVTVIHAVTGADPRPFAYYADDSNTDLAGHNIELVEAIFDKLPQYQLEWEVTDFPSIFAGLDSDKYQLGVNNFGMNDERKEKYLFTYPIFSNELIVIANKDIDLGEVTDYSDLAGYTFIGQAAVNQTTMVENYNEENPDAQITIQYTEEDLNMQLQDVESGKVDFTTMDAPMFYGYYNKEFGYDVNTSVLKGYSTADGLFSYLLVSKGNEQLVEDINAALKEVIADGTSKKICETYFEGDYSPALEDLK
ncbi:MAG: transporter substrate-binding domain-containing protein [Eubacterium sp.]|nr:transporter substrate-binding domain-containing protein [Eubacterium sp.]